MRARVSEEDIGRYKNYIASGIMRFSFYDRNPRYIAEVIEKLGPLFFQNGFTSTNVSSENSKGQPYYLLEFRSPQIKRGAV